MTHFVVAAIVPRKVWKEGNVEAYIDDMMAPYSEELEVEPRVDISADEVKKEYTKIMKEAQNLTEEELAKKDYMQKYKDNPKMPIREWAKDWYGQELDEEGNLLTTSNPDSFWDWYVIGGRWNGLFTGAKGEGESLRNNSITAKKLLVQYKKEIEARNSYKKATKILYENMTMDFPFGKNIGFADVCRKFAGEEKFKTKKWQKFYTDLEKTIAERIRDYPFYLESEVHKVVDEEGVHSATDFGWFGSSINTKTEEEWEKDYIKLLEKAGDGYVVNLDCHV